MNQSEISKELQEIYEERYAKWDIVTGTFREGYLKCMGDVEKLTEPIKPLLSHCKCGMAIDTPWKYCPMCGANFLKSDHKREKSNFIK